MARVQKPDRPVTIERVERALDKLAEMIVMMGDDGMKALPIYDRLESELEAMKAGADRLASVYKRADEVRRRRRSRE